MDEIVPLESCLDRPISPVSIWWISKRPTFYQKWPDSIIRDVSENPILFVRRLLYRSPLVMVWLNFGVLIQIHTQTRTQDDLASMSRNTNDLQRMFEEEKRSMHERGAAPQHQRMNEVFIDAYRNVYQSYIHIHAVHHHTIYTYDIDMYALSVFTSERGIYWIIYIYIYMCICMYRGVEMCMNTGVYVCMHTRGYMFVCICAYMCT